MTNFSFYMRRVSSAHKLQNLLHLRQKHFRKWTLGAFTAAIKCDTLRETKNQFFYLARVFSKQIINSTSSTPHQSRAARKKRKTRKITFYSNKKTRCNKKKKCTEIEKQKSLWPRALRGVMMMFTGAQHCVDTSRNQQMEHYTDGNYHNYFRK